jgi:hypothetical protein
MIAAPSLHTGVFGHVGSRLLQLLEEDGCIGRCLARHSDISKPPAIPGAVGSSNADQPVEFTSRTI